MKFITASKNSNRRLGECFPKKVFLALWLIFFSFGYVAQAKSPQSALPEASKLQKLQKNLNYIFKQQSPQNFFWGIKIVDLATEKTLYSLNAEKNFLPASNLKLILTAAAFEYLDLSFQYNLEAFLNTPPESGALIYNGDLIIRSNGNPCISSYWLDEQPTKIFQDLADSLLSKGIVLINGDIIGDDRAFEVSDLAMDFRGGDGDYVASWEFEDMVYAMASPASALSFNENMLDVEVFPNEEIGEPPIVKPSLKTSFFVILNQAITSASNSERTLRITRQLGTNNILISGQIPFNSRSVSEPIAIEEPALYFLTVLKETLHQKGVASSGALRRINTNEDFSNDLLIPLASFKSPSLLEILSYVNKESNNFSAQQVLRTLGEKVTQCASQDSGLCVVERFLASAHNDKSSYKIKDGSGLSRHNLISPETIVDVLTYRYKRPYFDDFVSTLSIAGVDGTLENRFKRSDLKGNIYGKTGYLSSVRTFSGYLETTNGKWIGFSLMAMNYTHATRDVEALTDKALELLKDW